MTYLLGSHHSAHYGTNNRQQSSIWGTIDTCFAQHFFPRRFSCCPSHLIQMCTMVPTMQDMPNPQPELVDPWCILTQTNPRCACFKKSGLGLRERSDRNRLLFFLFCCSQQPYFPAKWGPRKGKQGMGSTAFRSQHSQGPKSEHRSLGPTCLT